jgi:protein-S-isoprenylcysteine O-methyltransferase Ste14
VVTGLSLCAQSYVRGAIILGQAFLFGDLRLIAYGAVVWLAAHLYVVFYEEWRLNRTFGAQHRVYRSGVPRWIPRLTPWLGP